MASWSPTGLPVSIPSDVIELLLATFGSANSEVSETLSRQPMIREDSLDQGLISYLDRQSPVMAPTSGWIIDVETHFLGGGAHYLGKWEIADIGVLIVIRQGGAVKWSKVAILQSKRLFPLGAEYDEDVERQKFRWGFGRLHDLYEPLAAPRTYQFTTRSQYASLDLAASQATRIAAYQGEFGIPVHYLFYNPVRVPWATTVPSIGRGAVPQSTVGCRIVPARQIRELANRKIRVPSYKDIGSLAAPHDYAPFVAGWRLEEFVVSLLLGCHEGVVLSESVENAMEYLFYRRTGPIAAAFAVNLEMRG